jgi:hypothetical protein
LQVKLNILISRRDATIIRCRVCLLECFLRRYKARNGCLCYLTFLPPTDNGLVLGSIKHSLYLDKRSGGFIIEGREKKDGRKKERKTSGRREGIVKGRKKERRKGAKKREGGTEMVREKGKKERFYWFEGEALRSPQPLGMSYLAPMALVWTTRTSSSIRQVPFVTGSI